jgi:hypothetical protein
MHYLTGTYILIFIDRGLNKTLFCSQISILNTFGGGWWSPQLSCEELHHIPAK